MADDDPIPETKLTRTKQKWADERRFLTGRHTRPEAERLPPGQHLVQNWPVLDLGLTPEIAPGRWRLEIGGAVENPVLWSWADLLEAPQTEDVSDIHCVTTWSRYDNRWTGIATAHIADLVRPKADADFVLFHAHDGYTTNVTLTDFLREGSLLVHAWEGRPLAPEHGGPARLVIPHLYFWKSAKWIQRIEFRTRDAEGYWEQRGYHNRGDPWNEERYS
ncbi:sulfite oxidase-like oxidoreductase [Acuticoccus kandeliae]|uniref:sulfite oxidase-like oxidoreductase n=1 Tax=Acuticoccus kandeliae TaxID=2073160 RepID=UPI000D3E9251|nr:sulfite oxidase-like oxidoreductase [Acuticoccus kandeliae]